LKSPPEKGAPSTVKDPQNGGEPPPREKAPPKKGKKKPGLPPKNCPGKTPRGARKKGVKPTLRGKQKRRLTT